uniref:BPTI/Kunitz inhibitor domain-containing protein n=1 Tax=Plectus sambesii TaxID=2011161 RepID=A0A914W5J1_9BILA
MALLLQAANSCTHLYAVSVVILIGTIIGASACAQEPSIEFVPVGCRVIDDVIDGCPSKRIICQGGRALRSACLQHKDAGPCRAEITKFFYNPLTKRCEQFQYGGCLGNDNKFDTTYECEAACDANKLPEVLPFEVFLQNGVCAQTRQEGVGCNSQPLSTNWYYDVESGRCRSFRFLGCGGNDNRFPSKADCERRCVNGGDTDHQNRLQKCQQAAERGSCFSSHTRWFFDQRAGECATFVYSGCDGNDNNFETKQECEQACGETLACPYSRNRSYTVPDGCRLEWTRGQGPCETPVQVCDRDQQAVPNDKDDTHVCFKSAEKGRCSGSQVRFYFDSNSQDCMEFVYSGCESNGNNFDSKKSCLAACGGVTESSYLNKPIQYIFAGNDNVSDCALPAKVGWCFSRHERFFFDSFSGRCTSFQYSGCGGNANNFASELECERRCEDRSTNSVVQRKEPEVSEDDASIFCFQAPEQGPCSKWESRYAYNATSGQCESFFYGGCDGNKNNFRRQPECRTTCSQYTTSPSVANNRQQSKTSRKLWICDQPADEGDCFGQHERWRYDPALQTCVTFSFTGCGGNDNRFDTFDACIDACAGYRTAFADTELLGDIQSALLDDPEGQGAVLVINTRRTTACLQTPKPGPCKETFTRWYFDPATGSCATFQYGGCEANDNNFASQTECERSCVTEDEELPDDELASVCTEPMQPGPCRGRYTKYWFNKVARRCETFTYGGCSKNNNHFATLADCREVCGGGGRSKRSHRVQSTPSLCKERGDYGMGNCIGKGDVSKWFYNSLYGTCELFTYSGCGGNLNNFASWKECHKVCEEGYKVASGRPSFQGI